MAEYIEREALRKVLESWRDAHADVDDEQGCGLLEDVIWEVDAQPAADVVPVVHGRFVHDGPRFAGGVDWWHCSSCGRVVSGVETRFDYCPHCGAKMDGGDSDAAD
jgi:rubrerythrin